MAEVKSLVCDVCGGADATGFGMRKRPGAEWIIDLCEKCSTPMRLWQDHGRAPAGKKRPYRKHMEKVPYSPQ
jgi:hypothetical protein